jgi:translocator protein
MPVPPSRFAQRDVLSACAAAAVVMAALLLSQSASFPELTPWYAELLKPEFTPANWVYAPVWSTLYLLIGISLWRILRLPDGTAGRTRALAYSFIQLGLNAVWSWVFFGLHSPLLGLVDIYPQLAFILLAMAACARIDALAGACLVPLATWVAFASALNLAIWRLNG